MSETLTSMIKRMQEALERIEREKKSCQITFVVDMSQGGVRGVEVQTKERLK